MQLWPSRGTSVILTPDTLISRQIWVTWLLVLQHATISKHPRQARSRRTNCPESRREEGKGCAVCSTHLFISWYLHSTDRPCPRSVPSPAVKNVTSHPWHRRQDTRQWLWGVWPGEIGLSDVPAARGPQRTRHTAAFTVQPLAIRRNRQLEFKLDVLCDHED